MALQTNVRMVRSTSEAADLLPPLARSLYAEALDGYRARRLGSQRHHPKSVARDVAVVNDMVGFTGLPPWRWAVADYDRWCLDIGVTRRLANATQRHYQSALQGFLDYLMSNVGLANKIVREFGVRPVQIVHAENKIPHIIERELSQEKTALTHDEIILFFEKIDAAIKESGRFRGKDFRPLQRDKVLFYTIYVLGLRVSEALGLNVDSFEPNPTLPQMGSFGFARVWGKGSRGSGLKHRTIAVDNIVLPPLLRWYLDKIRPVFLHNADANEKALFLSERGRRLALSSLENRFQCLIANAGLEDRNFTPHCLRHSAVTHGAIITSLEAQRRKAGHVFLSTTSKYCHIPDEYINEQMTRNVLSQIASAKKESKK